MLRPILGLYLFSVLVGGCTPKVAPSEDAPAAAPPALAEAREDAPAAAPPAVAAASTDPPPSQVFGQPLSESLTPTPLASIVADPERYAGHVVKTEGEIAQVCQRMGCWMELRAENVAPIRVPMAGHAFFLPRDVASRRATVEGEVSVRELSTGERAHLESEGATATAQAIQIAATGVAIR